MGRHLRPGVVSVVVVQDRPGAQGLEPALRSLATAGLPPAVVQLVVVRAPGEHLPVDVRPQLIVEEAGHLGRRRTRGVDVADGQFLALVSGSVALPDGVLGGLLDTLHREVRTAAVGPTPDGTPGARYGGGARPADALSASLDLVLLRTAAWHQVGGLAPELNGVLEDVDLGWRLTLLGYRVRVRRDLPAALPDRTVDGDAMARARRVIAYRCLSDTVLQARSGGAGLDLTGEPELVAGRRLVQDLRRIDDREVLALISRDDLGVAPDPACVDALTDSAVLSRRRRILVVTGDTLGARMAGPAIRAWEIAHALADEHDVVLAALGGCTLISPSVDCRAVGEPELRALEQWCDVLVFQGFLLRDVPWLRNTSKVLVADMYDPIHLEVLEQDKHRPREERMVSLAEAVHVVNVQLARADFFLCASDKQRDLWLGHLASLGRVNPHTYDGDEDLDGLLIVVPFGTADDPPVHERQVIKGVVPGIGIDDKVVLWGGGIYNWFDPLTLLHAVDRVRRERDDVRLYFLGTKHPNPMVPAMRMAASARDLADRLQLTGSVVFFNEDWVAYDDRQNYLLEADVGVSCHYQHVETAFSFRTRILDYLWAGLPIVTTQGDAFGDLVAARGLGAAVPPEDPEALAAALLRVLDDGEASVCRERVRKAAVEYTWSRTLEPLLAFCRAPRHAPDRWEHPPPDPAAMLARPPKSLRSEVALARDYLQQGGMGEVARRASGRARRVLTQQRR